MTSDEPGSTGDQAFHDTEPFRLDGAIKPFFYWQMKYDTRDYNETFATESMAGYFDDYAGKLSEALGKIDRIQIQRAEEILRKARTFRKQIFVAGNGGSAAITEHMECDFQKGCEHKGSTLRTRSLTANSALTTAIANDLGFHRVFSFQLEMLAQPHDVLLLVSSSGNSPNIVDAAEFAKTLGMPLIGLTGFSGGKLKELADVAIHVPVENYGIVEDCHQAVMHAMAQFHYLKLKGS